MNYLEKNGVKVFRTSQLKHLFDNELHLPHNTSGWGWVEFYRLCQLLGTPDRLVVLEKYEPLSLSFIYTTQHTRIQIPTISHAGNFFGNLERSKMGANSVRFVPAGWVNDVLRAADLYVQAFEVIQTDEDIPDDEAGELWNVTQFPGFKNTFVYAINASGNRIPYS